MEEAAIAHQGLLDLDAGDWEHRLGVVVQTMREMSSHTDPEAMVAAYVRRMESFLPAELRMSLSRRELEAPRYRITRCNLWREPVNPWTQQDRLPVLRGGILAELIYGDQPRIIDDLHVPADDPAADYLAGVRSMMVIPLFDRGTSLNMVLMGRNRPGAFRRDNFPEIVWMSNLFGRTTYTLVLSDALKRAYEDMDRELQAVADIQRSLLPAALPRIPGLGLAVHYQTSRRAGGDYYDFFPMPDGRWGMLVADVSGHGTPAAVIMAITHCISHMHLHPPESPGVMLGFLNRHLTSRYTNGGGTFVTAFYAVYNPETRGLTYASAGHNPPRMKRCGDGSVQVLNHVGGLPLGVRAGETYDEAMLQLHSGDRIVFYTDGITESRNRTGECYGESRLDEALARCDADADNIIEMVISQLAAFAGDRPAEDDRTMLVARVE